jgi:hypothetical protein
MGVLDVLAEKERQKEALRRRARPSGAGGAERDW